MHILHYGEPCKNAVQLKGPANTESEHLVWFRMSDRLCTESNGAGIHLVIACNHIKERGFSRSIGADQTSNAALFHCDGTGAEGVNSSKRFRDVLYFQQAHCSIPFPELSTTIESS